MTKYKITDVRYNLPVNQKRIDGGEEIPLRTQGIKRIVIHCSDDDDKPGEDVYGLAHYDINPNHISSKGCFTITYTYYIEEVNNNLVIYKCTNYSTVTWHVGKWNSDSLAIGIDKKADDYAPTKWDAAVWLSAYLLKELNLTPNDVVFHRELEGTGWYWDKTKTKKIQRKTCPGMVWDEHKFRESVSLIFNKKENAKSLSLFKRFLGALSIIKRK